MESKDPKIEKYTKQNLPWNIFIQKKLEVINAKDNLFLGGKYPRAQPETFGIATTQIELPVKNPIIIELILSRV